MTIEDEIAQANANAQALAAAIRSIASVNGLALIAFAQLLEGKGVVDRDMLAKTFAILVDIARKGETTPGEHDVGIDILEKARMVIANPPVQPELGKAGPRFGVIDGGKG